MAFELPDLPYPKDALEPNISAETLEIHHDRHHNTYVTNLNNPGSRDRICGPVPGRHHQERLRRHLQQRGPGVEPHLLLGLPEPWGRR